MKIRLGATRIVIICKNYVYKFPIPYWDNRFTDGLNSNRQEYRMYHDATSSIWLGRVVWIALGGLILKMVRYKNVGNVDNVRNPLTNNDFIKYGSNYNNFGRDKQGYLYIIDYGIERGQRKQTPFMFFMRNVRKRLNLIEKK